MGKRYRSSGKRIPRTITMGVKNPNNSLYSNERFEKIEMTADVKVAALTGGNAALITMTDELNKGFATSNIYTIGDQPRHLIFTKLYSTFETIGLAMEVASGVSTAAGLSIGGPVMGG